MKNPSEVDVQLTGNPTRIALPDYISRTIAGEVLCNIWRTSSHTELLKLVSASDTLTGISTLLVPTRDAANDSLQFTIYFSGRFTRYVENAEAIEETMRSEPDPMIVTASWFYKRPIIILGVKDIIYPIHVTQGGERITKNSSFVITAKAIMWNIAEGNITNDSRIAALGELLPYEKRIVNAHFSGVDVDKGGSVGLRSHGDVPSDPLDIQITIPQTPSSQ